MNTYLPPSKDRNAFTLMELLIVLVILIVIMALVIPNVTRTWDKANRKATEAQIEKFTIALKDYHMDTGMYPTTKQGLMALVKCPEIDNSVTSLDPQSGTPGMGPNLNLNPDMDNTPFSDSMNSPFAPNQNPSQPWSPQPNTPSAPIQQTPTPGWAPQGLPGSDGPGQNPPPAWGDQQNPTGPTTFDNTPPSMGDMMTPPAMGDQQLGNQPGYGQQNTGSSDLMAKMANAIRKWGGPYLGEVTEVPLDIWNNEFHYEWPTDKTKDGFPAIWSNGKDETDPTWRISNFNEAETKIYKEQQQQERQRRIQDWQQRQGVGGIQGNQFGPDSGGQIPNQFGPDSGGQIPNQFGPDTGGQIPNQFGPDTGGQIPNQFDSGIGTTPSPMPTPPQPSPTPPQQPMNW